MKKFWPLALAIYTLHAVDPSFKFEGVLGAPSESIQNMNNNAQAFLPYNPVIVEIGAYEGTGTFALGSTYPYGQIFAFEPNPKAYAHLVEKTQNFGNISPVNLAVSSATGTAKLYGSAEKASLLSLDGKKNHTYVPTVVLDDWCRRQGIDHIDFLRLDANGLEWQIVESSPTILKDVIVLVVKTYMRSPVKGALAYSDLKRRLEKTGFELLSHWYQEGGEGEATFVRKYMYDALFR